MSAYRDALLRKAPDFGLDRVAVAAMHHPVLVRVVDSLSSTAPKSQLIAAVRRYNEGMTHARAERLRHALVVAAHRGDELRLRGRRAE